MSNLSLNPVYLSARAAIVAPERAIPASLYSVQKWLPRLGPERWCLIMLLRGLCIDAPRQSNGTKQVVCSIGELASALDMHQRTLLRWLKHEAIPNDSPWRKLIPVDEKTKYLAMFIPRLRYAYETHNGKTRRVGLVLEVLMEDPVIPEDEQKLAQQVELLQLQQGEMPLDTYRMADVPPSSTADDQFVSEPVNRQNDISPSPVNRQNVTSEPEVNRQNDISPSPVNRQNVTSEPEVNRQNDISPSPVNRQNVTSEPEVNRHSDISPQSVNEQSDTSPIVNRHSDISPMRDTEVVNGQNVSSEPEVNRHSDISPPIVNRQNVSSEPEVNRHSDISPPIVNRQNVTSEQDVNRHSGTSPPINRHSDRSPSSINRQDVSLPADSDPVNVNQLHVLFKHLNSLNVNPDQLNYQMFEPVVNLTEQLLEDTHSTGMLYKTLQALYPNQLNLFVMAVQTALLTASTNPQINKGAVFVRTLRELAETAEVDLGLKPTKSRRKSRQATETQPAPQIALNLPADDQSISVDEAIWQETKQALRQQMTRATYSSVIHDTKFVAREGNHYLIGVRTTMALEWLRNRLADVVQRTLCEVVGKMVTLEFKLINDRK